MQWKKILELQNWRNVKNLKPNSVCFFCHPHSHSDSFSFWFSCLLGKELCVMHCVEAPLYGVNLQEALISGMVDSAEVRIIDLVIFFLAVFR